MTEEMAESGENDSWENNGRIDISVKMKEYKCFRDEFVGFDRILPINVIIGRNNSGKSALLDMIQAISLWKQKSSDDVTFLLLSHTLRFPTDLQATFEYIMEIKDFECGVSVKHRNQHASFPNEESRRYAESHVLKVLEDNKCCIVCKTTQMANIQTVIQDKLPHDYYLNDLLITIKPQKSPYIPNIFRQVIFRRIRAERKIVPEPKSNSTETIDEHGQGATNVINVFCNNDDHNENVIRRDLLEAINCIFEPDNHFDEIRVVSTQRSGIAFQNKENSDELWEVVLYESEKNRVNLSQSGSGLQTVLLVLLNLLVVPKIPQNGYGESLPLNQFIFAFEELENNLHPSLLRRLFKYIENFVIKNSCYVFITTHSNVVIDFFSRSPYAQLIHVTHDGKQASAKTIETFIGKNAILDDLGVRASDLLQANGIVWLEGPSDRIYFNKWIEIFSDGELQEHRHYECAFYGGSLLSHHGVAETDDVDTDFVNILKINRHFVLIADSDKTSADDGLKPRLKSIIEKTESIVPKENIWVTDTKEIENYIPVESLRMLFDKDNLKPIQQYEIFYSDTEKKCYWKHSPKKTFDKVIFASKVVETYPSDNEETKRWLNLHDLNNRMTTFCDIIRSWNNENERAE